MTDRKKAIEKLLIKTGQNFDSLQKSFNAGITRAAIEMNGYRIVLKLEEIEEPEMNRCSRCNAEVEEELENEMCECCNDDMHG